MEVDLISGHSVDTPLGLGDAGKGGHGMFPDPGREAAFGDQGADAGERPLVVMGMGCMLVGVRGCMLMSSFFVRMIVSVVRVLVPVLVAGVVEFAMGVVVIGLQVNIKFDAFNVGLLAPGDVEMVAGDRQLAQFAFEFDGIDTEVDERAHEHVAADAAEKIEVERVHAGGRAARALIWLAA
jgi:hypothetical protein